MWARCCGAPQRKRMMMDDEYHSTAQLMIDGSDAATIVEIQACKAVYKLAQINLDMQSLAVFVEFVRCAGQHQQEAQLNDQQHSREHWRTDFE